MNHVLFIIPILLAVTIPNAFAEVGKNYDTVINEDETITWIDAPERILVDNEWQNYFLTVNDSKVIFNTNSVGSFVYDIPTCSYSIFENGYDGNQIIPSVSAVSTYLKDGTWQNMEVNNLSCNVTVEEFDDKVILTSTKEEISKFQQEIILDYKKGFKETFKVWHDGTEELGISQTVHVGESITIGNQTINIAQLNGQSFDRNYIIENKANILELTDSINYDFDTGIESLTNVNIIHDSNFFDNTYKINLDFSSGYVGTEEQTPFIGYLEIDPTFSQTATSANWGGSNSWDVSSLPTNAIISSGTAGGETLSATDISNIDAVKGTNTAYTRNVSNPQYTNTGSWSNLVTTFSGWSSSTQLPPMMDSSLTTSGKFQCYICGSFQGVFDTGVNQDQSLFVHHGSRVFQGTGGVTIYTSSTNSNWSQQFSNYGLSGNGYTMQDQRTTELNGTFRFMKFDFQGGGYDSDWQVFWMASQDISTAPELSLTYTLATIPDSITDLSASFNSPNVDLTFSTPNDGGSSITSFKVYRDTGSGYSLYDTVNTSSLTSYQDNNPVIGVINYYKVNTVNSIGEANDSNIGSVQTGTLPDAPTGLTSTIQDPNNSPLEVFLQWSSPVSWGSGTAQGFEVYRNGVLVTTTGLINSYTDTVTAGSHSHYVKAVSSVGTSGNSNTVNITTPDVPDAITDLSGNVISNTQINISWTAPNDQGSNIDDYKIYLDGTLWATTQNTSFTNDISPLVSNTSYTLTVYAVNSVGDSLVSNSVNLTTYQSVSGSITVTPNTQGASTQLTFSASGITGTPTPTFSTFTLKEGITVIASGITSPYNLALNDDSSHIYTVTSTDNTHWDSPTIQGNTTVTASYSPTWNNNISYNYTRASGVIDLTVNRDTQSLWDATCNYKTTAQVMADQSGIVSNFTNVWYINDSQNIADTDTVYVSCSEDGDTLLSFTSFGPNRLGGGIAQLDAVFGEWTGTPVALIFVLLVAGLFTGRSAPTGILLVLALIGVLGFIGMLTIDEAVWGFLLLAGVLGIFLGKRFL